jgi:aryl-phospho-beta-D-glucosidase BglC (GH1 family)
VGGWMNLENFINGYPGCESGLRRAMKKALGEENSRYFFDSLMTCFFAEEDLAFISGCGANVLRLPLNYRHFESDENPFEYREEGFKRLEAMLDLCEKYGLYVILDMHAVPGWQNAHWHSDNENAVSLFWHHRHFQDRLKALWQEFAGRYKNRAVVAAYELMNEPIVSTPAGDLPHLYFENYQYDWDTMNRVYAELVDAIRQVDNRHIIMLEGDRYGHDFDGLAPPFADNLLYSSHNYTMAGFGPGPYPGEYQPLHSGEADPNAGYWDRERQARIFGDSSGARYAQKYHVPLLAGEFGSQYNTGADDLPYRILAMDDQLDVFNRWGAHWTTWTFKDMGVMGWVSIDPTSEYAELTAPVQKKKTELGAENFVGWRSNPIGKQMNRRLAETITEIVGDESVSLGSSVSCLQVFTLTGFAAACLQPVYCRRFAGMTKTDIDRVMESFAFKNCVIRQPYRAVLEKRLREP